MDEKKEIINVKRQPRLAKSLGLISVPAINFDRQTLDLIKQTVAPETLTDKEFQLFIYQAKRTGLDPLNRQIYCIKSSKGKVSINATIDGLRLIAERTKLYQGQTPVEWCNSEGYWKDVWISEATNPTAARVGILKKGFTEPLYAVARFNTYAQRSFDGTLQYQWKKMPDFMISKCAEALALRKAFPQELSGIYAAEEMISEEEEPVKETKTFQQKAIDYYKTLKTRDILTAEYEKTKSRKEYTGLMKTEQAELDKQYLILLNKLPEIKKPVVVEPQPEPVVVVKADINPYIVLLQKAKTKLALEDKYNDIFNVPDMLQPSPEQRSIIKAEYMRLKNILPK